MTATIPTYGDLSDYGMGKFQKRVDKLAYENIIEGINDDTEGSDQYNGVIDLWIGTLQPGPIQLGQYDFTPEDMAFIAQQQAFIVESHPSGAVYVEWFTDGNAAQARFNAIRSDYATPDDWEY